MEDAEFDRIIAVNSSETAVIGMIRAKIFIGKFNAEVKLNILPQSNSP